MAAAGGLLSWLDLLLVLFWILAPCVGGTNSSTDCRDLHPLCEEWAIHEDKCWGSDPHYMVHKCAKSCGGCPTAECDDSPGHRHECDSLAHRGECRHNKVWMVQHCFRSCGYCRQEEIRQLQRTMVTTPKPSVEEECKNLNPACGAWAFDGQCWDNPYFMVKYCKLSCWACKGIHDKNCKDREKFKEKCPAWVKEGVCAKSKTWMYRNCHQSCGYCRRESLRVSSLEESARTTPTPTEECREVHKKCPQWAREGECWSNPYYMTRNCQQSCGTCPSNTDCKDSDRYFKRCPGLAKSGYCTKNPAWMVANCYRSCGFCRGTGNLTIGTPYKPLKYPDGRSCIDNHPGCVRWSIEGQCWINPYYMSPNCGLSCHTCDEVHNCHDLYEFKHQCPKWVAIDYCQKSKSWMKENCFRSCGYCMEAEYIEKYGNRSNAIRRLYSEAATVIPHTATHSAGWQPAAAPLGGWALLIVICMWVFVKP